MKKWLAGFLVVLFSLAIGLAGAELLLRLIQPFRFTPKNDFHFGKPILYRLSRNPDLGYEFRPNAVTEVKGIAYRINRYGFRDIEQHRKKNGKRVVIAGDSLTFGWDLPLEETYPFLTREALRSREVRPEIWAMGVTGYNTVQEYHLIRDQALRLDPDLVILQICLNDFEKAISIRPDRERYFRLTQYHEIPPLHGEWRSGFQKRSIASAARAMAAPKKNGADGPNPFQEPMPLQSTPAIREAGRSEIPRTAL